MAHHDTSTAPSRPGVDPRDRITGPIVLALLYSMQREEFDDAWRLAIFQVSCGRDYEPADALLRTWYLNHGGSAAIYVAAHNHAAALRYQLPAYPPLPHAPARTGAAVYAALAPDDQTKFDAAWRRACDTAATTHSTLELRHLVDTFWAARLSSHNHITNRLKQLDTKKPRRRLWPRARSA